MITMNREDIELVFYKVIKNELSVIEFEEWLYSIDDDVINANFGSDFYFELLDINYRSKFSLDELKKVIYSKIPFDKFESTTLKFLLNSLINETRDKADTLEILYDLYCKGYYFLRFLGIIYIRYGIDELPRLSVEKLWDEVSFIKKRDILNKLSPKLEAEAKRILGFLNNGLIKITNEFEYEDLRKEEDRIELNNLEQMYND